MASNPAMVQDSSVSKGGPGVVRGSVSGGDPAVVQDSVLVEVILLWFRTPLVVKVILPWFRT